MMAEYNKEESPAIIVIETPDRSPDEIDPDVWANAVRDANRDRCSNCGSTDQTVVQMVVPHETGGKYVLSNGVLLCRPCVLAKDAAGLGAPRERRPVNFWVSRGLYDRLKAMNSFSSMSALVRYLMSRYVRDELLFDDLEQFQEVGSDIKVNVWVDRDSYEVFKNLVNKRNMTVTDAIKSLIVMYENREDLCR